MYSVRPFGSLSTWKQLFVPEAPAGQCLQVKHLQAVLHSGSTLSSTLEEESFLRVIDEVVEQMAAGEKLVRDVGTGIHTREHAHRTAVDNDLIMLHEFGC